MSAPRKLRPARDRVAERGLPYQMPLGSSQWWAVLMTSGDRVPVVAFAEGGDVFVGYHLPEDAPKVAAKVARMRGIDGAVAITSKEMFA